MADTSFLEWPFFGDEHRALAKRLEAWCDGALRSDTHGDEDVGALCRAHVASLAHGGWLNHVVTSGYGGVGEQLDVRSLCLIRETLARRSALADFAFAMQGLGSGAISFFGSAEQKAAYLPAVRSGEKIAAFALTELASGSDVANMDSTAREEGDEYVIDGAKTFISNGGIADFYTLFVRTGEGPGAKGISAFIVDANTQGLEIAETIETMAPHPLATLVFRNMRVPKERMLGAPGQGFKIAMGTLDVFRTTVGAAALGFARRALDAALARATSRRLFGAALSENLIVQTKLAEMAVDVDAAALLVYRSGWQRDVVRGPNTREAAMAKLFATDRAQVVIDDALQIHGGRGVVTGEAVEVLYREIRALRIYEGASEVQKLVIARQMLRDLAAAP